MKENLSRQTADGSCFGIAQQSSMQEESTTRSRVVILGPTGPKSSTFRLKSTSVVSHKISFVEPSSHDDLVISVCVRRARREAQHVDE
jgi:hypothetical protein